MLDGYLFLSRLKATKNFDGKIPLEKMPFIPYLKNLINMIPVWFLYAPPPQKNNYHDFFKIPINTLIHVWIVEVSMIFMYYM